MSNYNSIKSLFNDIAVKIQDKLGNHTDKIKADDFPSAIESIAGGSWLPSAETVLATFARRQSGGDGPATIEKIYGKTVVWNQGIGSANLYSTGENNGVTFTKADDHYTLSGTATADVNIPRVQHFQQITGHKYFCISSVPAVSFVANNAGGFGGTITSAGIIVDCTQSSDNQGFSARAPQNSSFNGEALYLRIIDLTKMYGEGHEPSTVAEFLAMHPEALTAPYDAGSLLPVKAEKIMTRGVNQWDEEWENGTFNTTTGANINTSWTNLQIRTKNLISVIGGQTYYFKTAASGGTLWVMLYDSSMTIIDASALGQSSSGNCFSINNNTETLPANAAYLKFYIVSSYPSTYQHDICINISDSSINGQYFPHHNSDVGLPILKHFPKGLRGVGDSYDEIGQKKKVQRRGVVDLGTLNWGGSPSNRFVATLADIKQVVASAKANILCAKLETATANAIYLHQGENIIASTGNALWVYTPSYTDAATFKAAMSGVELDYPLAEPIETDINEDMTYLPQLGGTEEVSPISAEFKAEIRYARKINE